MTDQKFVVVDIETTGNSPKKGDKIIQIAAVVIKNGQIVERFSKYLNPGKAIPGFIEQLTGIKQHMVDDAVFFEDIAQEVSDLLKDAYFVAHNVHFDLGFLNGELQACGMNELSVHVIDTVEISRILYPEFEGYKLTELSEELMLPHDHPHRADSDAEVTAMLFLKLMEKLQQAPPPVLKQLRRLSQSFISDIGLLLERMIADHQYEHHYVEIASFAIQDVTKSSSHSTDQIRVDFDQLFLEAKKQLSQSLTGYEVRAGQLTMMDKVRVAFNERQYALIEAAPGIGKTLAYLIPAVLEAKESGQPVIISTYSIVLQQQMLNRDVPILNRLFPFDINACILKGRAHYICIDKFEHVLHEEDDNYDVVLTKAQILMWLMTTKTGDLSEINLPSGAAYIKDRISCGHMPFTAKKRRFREYCFYERAKEKAKTADLIITNHRLLLSQTEASSVLKGADVYVIDEAHHFEKTANETLGMSASYIQLHAKLTQLGSLHQGGLLKKMKKRFHSFGLKTDTFVELDEKLMDVQTESDAFFSAIHSFVKKTKPKADINRLIFRVKHDSGKHQWKRINETANKLCSLLISCEKLYEQQKEELMQCEEKLAGNVAFEAEEYDQVMAFIQSFCNTLYRFMFEPQNGETVWIEIDAKGAKNAVFMHAQPIDTGELLADRFFMNKKSVVLTSGTLTVNERFDYSMERLGLHDFYPLLVKLESPFAFEKQLSVMIPTDMPHIQDRDELEYAKHAANYIQIMEQQKDAKILVLFNSHEMLKTVYEELKAQGSHSTLLAQGVTGGSPVKLMKTFKTAKQAILLGTGSFWEGVDFPGSELTTVIMARLPFRPPDSPLVEAKCEAVKKQGKNPFKAVALPEAVLTFKQGAGRLLRSERDIGTLLILDRRVKTASYGKLFLEALPGAPVHETSKEALKAYIEALNSKKPLT
ncbi:ATP-dependent DNA helicase DinG [Bacillus sp. NPDC077027]|uniref:ATP-dependent DNA helicase DinG n=1 Tax=Bacillus sp. NPDC077027 TaxID=3390548 RepID=UPI003D015FF8